MTEMKYFGPLKGKPRKPRGSWGFDCEWDNNNKAEFVNASFYKNDTVAKFKDKVEMAQHLALKARPCVYIVAHNLEVDINCLLYKNPYERYFVRNTQDGKLYTVNFWVDKKTRKFINPENVKEYPDKKLKFEFRDTTNFNQAPLSSLGKDLNIPKLTSPKALGRLPTTSEEWDELDIYNIQDSRIAKEWYDFFERSIYELGGVVQSTMAKTALDLFRRKYMEKDDKWTLPTPDDLLFHIESYKGGRTEVFIRGLAKQSVQCYDFNSMYPHVMSTTDFPHPSNFRSSNSSLRKIQTYEGISEVTVFCPFMEIPILATRYEIEKSDKTLFPTGVFTGVFCHNELRYALEHGYKILKFGRCDFSTKNFRPFKKFIDDLYKKRLEYKAQGSGMQLVCKLCMNSLYGKFAQKIRDTLVYKHLDNVDKDNLPEGSEMFDGKSFCQVLVKGSGKQSIFMHPILASYVSSQGRINLHKAMMKTKNNGGKVYYCDTDSIMIDQELDSKNDKTLGALSLEKMMYDARFIRPKLYYYNENAAFFLKAKGLQAQKRFYKTHDLIAKIINKKAISQIRFVKWRSHLKSKAHHKSGLLAPNEQIMFDKLTGLEDNKRVWGAKYDNNKEQSSTPIELKDPLPFKFIIPK